MRQKGTIGKFTASTLASSNEITGDVPVERPEASDYLMMCFYRGGRPASTTEAAGLKGRVPKPRGRSPDTAQPSQTSYLQSHPTFFPNTAIPRQPGHSPAPVPLLLSLGVAQQHSVTPPGSNKPTS